MSGNFGFLILVVAAFLVGAAIYSLAGTAYLSVIVDRVTNMSESDLGIYKDKDLDDRMRNLSAEIEKSKERMAESRRQFDQIGKFRSR
jgi:hypothetical protein